MTKPILITGASSGIGYELAKVCAHNGHDLVLVARREDRLKDLKAELQAAHPIHVWTYRADLTDEAVRQQLFDWTQAEGISLYGLVNNAGLGDFSPFAKTDWSRQDQMLQLNMVALTHLTRLFVPGMVQQGQGRILNVASTAAFQPGPLMAVYFATKAYVLSLTEALASELEGTGVAATTLCPGPTQSEFGEISEMEKSKLFKNQTLATSAEVAEYGYSAMQKGERVAVHGLKNQLLVLANRFLPRSTVTDAIRNLQKPA